MTEEITTEPEVLNTDFTDKDLLIFKLKDEISTLQHELSTIKNQFSSILTKLDQQSSTIHTKQDQITGILTSLINNTLPSDKVLITSDRNITTHTVSIEELNQLLNIRPEPIQSQLDHKQDIITGAISTILDKDLAHNVLVVTDMSGKLVDLPNVTSREAQYLSGVDKPIQDQINSKQDKIYGAATSILHNNLKEDSVVVTTPAGKITTYAISIKELSALSDISSNIQAQLNDKQRRITGAISTVTNRDLDNNSVVCTDIDGKLTTTTISIKELGMLSGVISPLQDQINTKQPRINGAISTVTNRNLPSDMLVITDKEGKITTGVSVQSLSVLDGIRANIQSQLDHKQGLLDGALSVVANNPVEIKRVIISDDNGKLTDSDICLEQLYTLKDIVTGRTIQEQLDSKQSKITGTLSTAVSGHLPSNSIVITNDQQKLDVCKDVTLDELKCLAGIKLPIMSLFTTKQDRLIDQQTIRSINGVSLLGEGNINITVEVNLGTPSNVDGILKSKDGVITKADAGVDYQAPLRAGENIKTINGMSLVGKGNLELATKEQLQLVVNELEKLKR